METLIVITIIVLAGGAVFTYNSSESHPKATKISYEDELKEKNRRNCRRRIEQEEARLREAEAKQILERLVEGAIKDCLQRRNRAITKARLPALQKMKAKLQPYRR